MFQVDVLERDENWQMAKQFIIDIQQNVLITDGFISSPALTSTAVTPSQISGKFNAISYSKGNVRFFSCTFDLKTKYCLFFLPKMITLGLKHVSRVKQS